MNLSPDSIDDVFAKSLDINELLAALAQQQDPDFVQHLLQEWAIKCAKLHQPDVFQTILSDFRPHDPIWTASLASECLYASLHHQDQTMVNILLPMQSAESIETFIEQSLIPGFPPKLEMLWEALDHLPVQHQEKFKRDACWFQAEAVAAGSSSNTDLLHKMTQSCDMFPMFHDTFKFLTSDYKKGGYKPLKSSDIIEGVLQYHQMLKLSVLDTLWGYITPKNIQADPKSYKLFHRALSSPKLKKHFPVFHTHHDKQAIWLGLGQTSSSSKPTRTLKF